MLHQLAGSTIDGATYTLDNAGNRTAKTDQRAAVTSNYGYDAIYELTGVTQGANTTESYTYDPVGNRLSSLGVSPYSVNVSNELTSTPSTSYTYDNNGNMLTKIDTTGTTTYAWDFENRLTSVTLPGTGGTVSFKYDPFGRRIQKSFTTGANPPTTTTTTYVYDADNLIEQVDLNGAVLARYAEGLNIDEPLAMLRGGATSYYHADGLDSVTSLSNVAGALAQTYAYDSFGKQTSSSGSLTNPFQYTAREFDAETNLQFSRARYYDPATGRFLSEDPFWINIQDARTSAYAYVSNEPTSATDPLGLYGLSKKGNPPPVPPSPRLDKALRCLEGCYGKPLLITSTSEPIPQHKPGSPHRRGEAADISYPTDPAKLLCCAAGCNFQFGLDEKEHPSSPGVPPHIHVQFTPATPNNVKNHPEWPNGIHGDLPPAGPTCACGTGAL